MAIEQLQIEPIRPDDIDKIKENEFPPLLIKAVNNLIIQNWNLIRKYSTIRMGDIIKEYAFLNGDDRNLSAIRTELNNANVLDIEVPFKKAGWDVKWDNDTDVFTFKK
jgi:hypothetical protein